MKKKIKSPQRIGDGKKFERFLPLYTSLIAATCTLLGALGGAFWQANANQQQKIYETRTKVYDAVLMNLKLTPLPPLKMMSAFSTQSKKVSTDSEIFDLETDWHRFIQSVEGKEAAEALKVALYPLILHGGDQTIKATRAVIASLNLEYPIAQLQVADPKIANDFLHAIDPSTSCYGCNDKIESHVSARLLALNSLLSKLENTMMCDLNSSSKLCS